MYCTPMLRDYYTPNRCIIFSKPSLVKCQFITGNIERDV